MQRITWGLCGCFALFWGWILIALTLTAPPEPSTNIMIYVWSVVAGALVAGGVYALGEAILPNPEGIAFLIVRGLALALLVAVPICIAVINDMFDKTARIDASEVIERAHRERLELLSQGDSTVWGRAYGE